MRLKDFLTGPDRYHAGSTVSPRWVVPVAIAIFVVAQVLAGFLYKIVIGFDQKSLGQLGQGALSDVVMQNLLLSQIFIVILAIIAVRLLGGWPMADLRLQPPSGGLNDYVLAIVVMVPVLAVVNAVALLLRPADFFADFRIFVDTARSPQPFVPMLAIGLGAPWSEEVLFRGFLLTPLAATRLGFWPAALLITLAWTLLHWGYSIVGLVEVFLIGVFFAWLLKRTGSLRVPLFCHALYNSCLFLALRWVPLPAAT